MRFCVDEAGLEFPPDAGLQTVLLETLGLLVQRCHAEGHRVERSDDLFSKEVLLGVSLCDLLYDPSREIDREVRSLASVALDRCVIWDDAGQLPDPIEVEIGGVTFPARSIAHAHLLARDSEAAGLLQAGSSRRGPLPVTRDGATFDLEFLASENDLLPFYRHVPELEAMDADHYLAHALFAFPAIHFVDGLARQTKRFSRPFGDLRADVTRHLAALNDFFSAIFADCSGVPVSVSSTFRAQCGVDASPESGNTRQNSAAWKERQVAVDGQEVYCSWHTKIEPHRDRIHFHPGREGVANGRLIVGIFHEHLST